LTLSSICPPLGFAHLIARYKMIALLITQYIFGCDMPKDLRDSIERLLSEERLSLTQLAQEQRVSCPSTWRWSTRGVDGHVLETFKLGGKKRYTTREAFSRWVARINGEKVIGSETLAKRRGRASHAAKQLARLGVQ
jgi:hypothetical protein